MSKDMLLDGIATLIGGRVAEELMYPENEKTDGATVSFDCLAESIGCCGFSWSRRRCTVCITP